VSNPLSSAPFLECLDQALPASLVVATHPGESLLPTEETHSICLASGDASPRTPHSSIGSLSVAMLFRGDLCRGLPMAERQLKTFISVESTVRNLVFESRPSSSSTPADEFTTVREPCTRRESGFWRRSSWVLRCFMGFQQWKSRTLRWPSRKSACLGAQFWTPYELQYMCCREYVNHDVDPQEESRHEVISRPRCH